MKTLLLWIWRTFLGALFAFLIPSTLHSQTVSLAGVQTAVTGGLNFPTGVAVDAAGDVFVADQVNNRVLKVLAGGGAQTTVGSGAPLLTNLETRSAAHPFVLRRTRRASVETYQNRIKTIRDERSEVIR